MSYEDCETVQQMCRSLEEGPSDSSMFDSVPPGDKGFDISHAGGEHDAFDNLAEALSKLSGQ